ncbi:hypothetical protein [Cohnella soli]|uniref:Uncharacterized protein n=1 Tax=Cohnella soli TaxID=425005 RepID=A0ABW0HR56_9BACL
MANESAPAQFVPLELAVARLGLTAAERDETLSNYMYMYRDGDIFAYKHYWTRHYVYLNEVGTIQDGVLNTGDYNSVLELDKPPAERVTPCFICGSAAAAEFAGASICSSCESIVQQTPTTAPVSNMSEEARRKMAFLIVKVYLELEEEETGE